MAGKVNITKRVLTTNGKRWCPVLVSDNGRIKPDWVLVNGNPQHHPEGRYYIDWRQHGKRRRESVGASPAQAVARQQRKQAELKAVAQGLGLAPQEDTSKLRRIDAGVSDYMEDIRLSKAKKTVSAYANDLGYFIESCSKTYLEQIERKDMLRFAAYLRNEKGLADRTCWNKFANVMAFLKASGVGKILRKGDWPTYVEEEPDAYERDELDTFFHACDPQEKVLFEFLLMTGMRDQEAIHTMWRNVRWKQGTIEMKWKPEYNWKPKKYKEREIPVPGKLLDSLRSIQPSPCPKDSLIFSTASGGRQFHFWEKTKEVARRAGLDEAEWWPHKFRATFATWHLQAGVDLRTVQTWMAHTDLESTLRYLKAARGAGVQAKVNATFG